MELAMDQQAGVRMIEKLMQQYGCLPSLTDGPVLPQFDALALAQALEQEVNRAGLYGWTKITVHMDIPDAALLAQYLRREG